MIGLNVLDIILQLNWHELLTHAGKISHKMALEKSSIEYEAYKKQQQQLKYQNSINELENDIKTVK